MKHLVAGGIVAGVSLGVFFIWALLGALVGPTWAIIVLLTTLVIWGAVAMLDYLSEARKEG